MTTPAITNTLSIICDTVATDFNSRPLIIPIIGTKATAITIANVMKNLCLAKKTENFSLM